MAQYSIGDLVRINENITGLSPSHPLWLFDKREEYMVTGVPAYHTSTKEKLCKVLVVKNAPGCDYLGRILYVGEKDLKDRFHLIKGNNTTSYFPNLSNETI